MSAPKTRKSVPLSERVEVDTTQVNVAVEGIDTTRLPGSIRVHLLVDGERIASRFLFRPSSHCDPSAPSPVSQAPERDQLVHFDFLLPIETVSGARLGIEVEMLEGEDFSPPISTALLGNPTLSVHLMLEIDSRSTGDAHD